LRDRILATFRYTIKKGPYKAVYIVLPAYIYCVNNRLSIFTQIINIPHFNRHR